MQKIQLKELREDADQQLSKLAESILGVTVLASGHRNVSPTVLIVSTGDGAWPATTLVAGAGFINSLIVESSDDRVGAAVREHLNVYLRVGYRYRYLV
jgi:hypothetical protein